MKLQNMISGKKRNTPKYFTRNSFCIFSICVSNYVSKIWLSTSVLKYKINKYTSGCEKNVHVRLIFFFFFRHP
jgi:hypothetical protein